MHVFVTGASGWIGSAVVPELIAAGHTVSGLARSDASAARVEAAGGTAVRADIGNDADIAVLRDAAAGADAVVHLAFRHDLAFTGGMDRAADTDVRIVEAFGEVLAGTGRALTIAAGALAVTPGRVLVEDQGIPSDGMSRERANRAALDLAGRDVRSSVVRLSPTVHGDGDAGFVPTLIDIARTSGVSGYPGDGSARWTAVHRSDAARLFRLAIEVAPAGSVLHAIDDEGIPIKEIAATIGRHLDVPVRAIPDDEAGEHFGFLARFLGLDSPGSSAITRKVTGWEPAGPGLIEDLDAGHYFSPGAGSKY